MKKVLVGGWFTLPRLSREDFSLLMRQGVKYDREMGFRIEPETDLESAVRTIRSAVGEEVSLVLRCFVCGRDACDGCPYLETCDRTKVSSMCLCGEHSPETDAYPLYVKAASESLAG